MGGMHLVTEICTMIQPKTTSFGAHGSQLGRKEINLLTKPSVTGH